MAIFHLCQRVVNSSKGQSAAARVKYILRQGEYEKRADLVASGASAMPEWAIDAQDFFKAADSFEKRGQVAKSLDIALPQELTPGQRESLGACRRITDD